MNAPASGVKVRMYRSGHGDCFLLAFRRDDGDPCHVLIDFGFLSGSLTGAQAEAILEHIRDATGSQLEAVIITHEHEDHMSGFDVHADGQAFSDIQIGRVWRPWTDQPGDPMAEALRTEFNDTIAALGLACEQLPDGDDPLADPADVAFGARLRALVAHAPGPFGMTGTKIKEIVGGVRQRAGDRLLHLRPDQGPYWLPHVPGLRIYALGPPRNPDLLRKLKPWKAEEFPKTEDDNPGFLLGPATVPVGEILGPDQIRPFAPRYTLDPDQAREGEFFRDTYDDDDQRWRRIDHDWLRASEVFALRMGDFTNNCSLVIAIELPASRQVLLFPGDAQRGNWIGWRDLQWHLPGAQPGDPPQTARELLSRVVLYKVGHHGSHNATLKGGADSPHPSLGWMGLGSYASRFAAMIPADTHWADTKRHWEHPLRSIKEALEAKGALLTADMPLPPPAEREQQLPGGKVTHHELYVEYEVFDAI